ncbi:MAG: SDR family NAD(P)-dependent oxidoreductase [Actinobacteria bacterium]|nr:SDR family NAD(P)-dependent oxidoreductase [Actinomycetota bacterium]MBU1944927.1 SDR family NAD(P)-dependent oxidoreductase [Actinomycetota bacterium]MBU2688147.1 SDR family NAD(P)-dependent oxidoreductase [Actinomycetota bacterium]
MRDLEGKVVLITGAARGMGRLHAINFAREGSRVVITDVDESELEKTAGEMRLAGFEAYPYVHDVSDRAACFDLVARVESEVGPVDVLVNNAGVVECGDFLDLSERSIRRMMDVNYFGQAWMMQAALPRMAARRSGHVVNICSSAGKLGVARLGPYCATKFASIGLTDSVRPELRRRKVRFTIVNPGYVNTGMFEGAKMVLISRWQDPQKVSDAVVLAVKKNRREICVPRFAVHLAAFVRGFCIPWLSDLAGIVFRADSSFKTWRKDHARPF